MDKPLAFALSAVALAGALVAGATWAAQAGRSAEAADKTLGMAVMGADVDYNEGTLLSGSGVVSSSRISTGRFQVTFVRDIEDCYVVATTYDAGVGRGFALTWLHSGKSVQVVTCNPAADCNGSPADHSFQVIAFCPK